MPLERLKPSFTFDKELIQQLNQLIPECFEDGKINWEILKEALGEFLEDESPEAEHFGLNWPGKKEARKMAFTHSKGNLVPLPGEGINEENTRNIFIEGENLEVLKLLQKSYAGRIKVIYIDPPYNTGKDFIYEDNFTEPLEEYLRRTGQLDEHGKPLTTNTKADGRFHSKWLSMMYPRLRLARNLLRDDGVIFISIGAEELHNLINLMNEIFGAECQKNIIVIRRGIKSVQAQFETIDSFNKGHEYIVFYAKQANYRFEKCYVPYAINLEEEDTVIQGSWNNHWRGTDRPTMRYEIFGIKPETGQWRWSEERSKKAISNWESLCRDIGENASQMDIDKWVVEKEKYSNLKFDLLRLSATGKPVHYIRPSEGKLASDLWIDIKPNGSSQFKKCMGEKYFDNPKSIDLLSRIIEFSCATNGIILDFFSGSATTAHAVLDLNNKDGVNRTFILVQLPEPCSTKSEAFKAGYKTIAEIGRERIRRVIKKLNDEQEGKLKLENASVQDFGFKVFKLDKSNYKTWNNYSGTNIKELESQYDMFESPLVDNWTKESLLTEILLCEGFPLDSKIEDDDIYKKNKLFRVSSNFCEHKLLICLDNKVEAITIENLELKDDEIFICLDNAINDVQKLILTDKGVIKTI